MPGSRSSGEQAIAVSSLIVMGGFVLSKAIGVVRQSIIARTFGASDQLDAYYAAFKLPDLLLTLIAGGAIATTFIPVFSEHLARGERARAWRTASVVLNVLLGTMTFVALVTALLAPWLVRTLIAPGFAPDLQALTARLLRLVLLSSLLFVVSSLAMSVLQAHGHFLLPALADFFYDVGIIGGALFLTPRLGIRGLAWGVVAGAGLHLLVQLPGLLQYGARYVPTLQIGDRDLLQLGRLMGPRILILGMFQLVFLFTTNLASRLQEGSITALNVGWIVMQMPEVIFGTSIATAAFPTLSRLATQGEEHRLADAVSGTLQAILLTAIPSTVALLLLGRSYVALLFHSSTFDERAIEMVYAAAAAFGAGLVGHSVLELAARLFYAHQNTLTPFWIALGATVLNLALCLVLAPLLGLAGLALANSIAVTLQSSVLLWLGGRSLVRYPWRQIRSLTGKAVLASAAMAVSILLITGRQAELGSLRTALLASAVGGITYLILVALLNRQETLHLAGVLRSRLAR